ncbi:HesA/MoeB/ThiF family protein [Marinomonas transparens]|uniref:Molybdopterin-synthase adenylyltransferase n=1 Tax=Marinomonas transparens TaxID=2795388 RepID=A0A934N1W0_9GAMM|nr:HesA/MoeB/ThiF family protein [Marinomonas transparens]MBJ7539905.1 HesA/MoeB/ThiF family protein [Marinomonas transparens]
MKLSEIGFIGQERLKSSRVLVIGAGGLGSPALLYLAAAGVGTIGIIDADIVDETNLQRQVIHNTKNVGKKKVESAKEALLALNPTITVNTFDVFLTENNADEIVGDYDILLDGCDNLQTRYLVNDACKLAGIPFVYASIYKFEAQITIFGLPNSPCYRCLFAEPPEDVPTCGDAGVLGTLPGMVGCLQATEAIKYLVGFGDLLAGKMLVLNLADHEYEKVSVNKKASCKACNGSLTRIGDLPFEAFCSLSTTNKSEENLNTVPVISSAELRKKISRQSVTLIDVRDDYEYEYNHLPSAHSVPVSIMKKGDSDGEYLKKILSIINEKDIVVFYCKSGIRSKKVLEAIYSGLNHNSKTAYTLTGGVINWKKENPNFLII